MPTLGLEPQDIDASRTPDALTALIGQRYGQAPAGPTLPGIARSRQAVLTPLLSHRSVRRYLSKALSPGTLELLVAAAQSASSSSNLQLWSVLSVDDPQRRLALSEVAGGQEHILQCPLFLVWIADLHRPAALAEERAIEHVGLDYSETGRERHGAARARSAAASAPSAGLCVALTARPDLTPLCGASALTGAPQQASHVLGSATLGLPSLP